MVELSSREKVVYFRTAGDPEALSHEVEEAHFRGRFLWAALPPLRLLQCHPGPFLPGLTWTGGPLTGIGWKLGILLGRKQQFHEVSG